MNSRFVLGCKAVSILSGMLACLLFVSSCKDSDEPDVLKDDVNTWIYKTMTDYYLWYDEIPAKNKLDFNQSPEDFFNSLLYLEEDGAVIYGQNYVFSRIEKKKGTAKSIDTSDSYGFDFALYSLQDASYLYARVIAVYPNSPASEAGLQRGDWILGVNSLNNITTAKALYAGGKTTFLIGEYDMERERLVFSKELPIGSSRAVEDTPFLKDTVLHIGEKNIGYLMYNTFSSGPTDNDNTYDDRLKQIFSSFKSRNVNEFVLDLRYNGGGLVSCAQLLTSLLVPASDLGKTFCLMEYNDKKKELNQSLLLKKNSEMSNANLNLKRVYVLVGEATASASEAVINCLKPYAESVTLIGEKTVGKRVGSIIFGEREDYDYLLHPIVLRIYNGKHEADYANGFTPDIYADELYSHEKLYPFGDARETLFGIALAQITGQTFRAASTSASAKSMDANVTFPTLERRRVKGLIWDVEK